MAKYGGMTVGERLFTAGLLDSWRAAAEARNREEMIAILNRVELFGDRAATVADSILADPAKYGF